jgi:ATP-dependent Clp protease ATP-binding subunit ClpC
MRFTARSCQCRYRDGVFERFTERARQVVVLAQDEARGLGHNYIGTEHLLLGLLREEEGIAARVLEGLDVELDDVRAHVSRIVGQGDEVTPGQVPFTPRAKKVLELSLREALALEHNYIDTEHVLLGIVREGDGVAAHILRELGADDEKVRNEVQRLASGPPARRGLVRRPPKWRYHVVEPADAEISEEWLNKLGAGGWELVTIAETSSGLRAVFKRPA